MPFYKDAAPLGLKCGGEVSFRRVLHDFDFLRRQGVEGVNLFVNLALQGASAVAAR